MSEINQEQGHGIEQRLQHLRAEFNVGPDIENSGLIIGIAEEARQVGNEALLQAGHEVTPAIETAADASNILMPPKPASGEPKTRWQLLQDAKKEVVAAAEGKERELIELAQALDMRREESLSDVDIARIDKERAIWLIEGGANRTSIVRRSLAISAMQQLYGDDLTDYSIYQFGSEAQKVPVERNGKPNPAYEIAQEIAGDYLREGDELNEFGLNLATALQSGWTIESHDGNTVILRQDGMPDLVMSKVTTLRDGFDTIQADVGNLTDRQFVIATNGQYRPKDELMALNWAKQRGISLLPTVVLGDEPGFTIEHRGKAIATAGRKPLVYLNEIVALQRLDDKATQ